MLVMFAASLFNADTSIPTSPLTETAYASSLCHFTDDGPLHEVCEMILLGCSHVT